MRLTTKGRLAVVAMIDVALHHKAGPIALAVVSRRQRISISYLEQMFSDLRRHDLVASTRGPGGGYTLGRDSAQITVADILFAVDSPLSEARRPAGDATAAAPGAQRCSTPELWDSLNRNVVEFLDSVTLRKLADDQIALGVQLREDEPAARRAEPVRQPVKPMRPNAPNSVFELGKFGRLA
jgi:Rrf2 family iron-sulfur cluster assembly transcriptional regulator